MLRVRFVATTLTLATLSASAFALKPDQRVENFRLPDQTGASHQLYYYSDMDAVVIMAQDASCKLMDQAAVQLAALQQAHGDGNIAFFMLNSSLTAEHVRHAPDQTAIPVLIDSSQLIGESLALSSAGEVLVVNPKTWQLAYRGGAEGAANALQAIVAGEAVEASVTEVEGCAIAYPEVQAKASHADISYSETIAPMLLENCVTCHREGGIGPWSMTNYDMIRGFAPMIREVVRTHRMPPWHADSKHGSFSNDRSLTDEETRTLIHWIEAGAPRGEGRDLLAEYKYAGTEWVLGEPDLILEIPPTDVPATGVVDYQYKHVSNPLDHDVWVMASEILPGSRSVLHHVITRFGELETEGPRAGHLKRRGGGGLAGYVPGAVAKAYPEGTGTLLPAGATIEFQMHYTPTGQAQVDQSRIGIYLLDEPPQHQIRSIVLINPFIRIPPNAKAHKEFAQQVVKQDALVYSLLPHAHFRGKASEFRAVYPNGSEEVLLSVPNYDFNWQTTYTLTEPKLLPEGTKIIHTTWWDNSAQNPANPDPSREVPWGEQSWDEMLFGAITLRYLDETDVDLKAELAARFAQTTASGAD